MKFKFPYRRPRGQKGFAGFACMALFLTLAAPLSCVPRFAQRDLLIRRSGGEPVRIHVELARTGAERAQGLMNRKTLDDGKGMLFIFERDEILSFWMKNTLVPLSIAFIAKDGRILEIRDMRPLDQSSVRSSRSARYALEAPRGWFSRAGIAVGDTLVLDEDLKGRP
jgi:uncharacterized membrane protein (UPF0127 family)